MLLAGDRRFVVVLMSLLAALLFVPEVRAQAPGEGAILEEAPNVVIQNRRFNLGTEFVVAGGILPLDPFYRSLHGGGRMSIHMGAHHALEVGGLYAFNVTTSLRDQLRDNFAIADTQPGVEQPLFVADASYVVKPLYGKLTLFNRSLIYNELFLALGAAGAGYQRSAELIPMLGPAVGGGVRVFLTDFFSLRLDVRHYVLFGTALNNEPTQPRFQEQELLIENVMNVSLGIALNFGGG